MDYETYLMLFTTMREEKEKWVGDYHLRYVETYDSTKIVISKSVDGSLLKELGTFCLEEFFYDLEELCKYNTLTEYLTHVENRYIKNKEEEKRVKSKLDRFLR
ncbi:hypothetical protein [Mammaliicoccus phage vB_MscM-PMS3]|nr:hypothetical protein [Mammaliicoccus phage vB_MscM-PMS3]